MWVYNHLHLLEISGETHIHHIIIHYAIMLAAFGKQYFNKLFTLNHVHCKFLQSRLFPGKKTDTYTFSLNKKIKRNHLKSKLYCGTLNTVDLNSSVRHVSTPLLWRETWPPVSRPHVHRLLFFRLLSSAQLRRERRSPSPPSPLRHREEQNDRTTYETKTILWTSLTQQCPPPFPPPQVQRGSPWVRSVVSFSFCFFLKV